MIAGFIILRLRSILGRKTGHEDKIYTGLSDKKFKEFQRKQGVNYESTKSDDIEGEKRVKILKGAEVA